MTAAPAFKVVDDAPIDQPYDLLAEQALIGALLLSPTPAPAVALIVSSDHFFEHLHRVIFGAIEGLIAAGRPHDVLTVGAVLSAVEMPEGAPPIREYLSRLAAEAVTVCDAPAWARMVRDLAHRRDILAAAVDLASGVRTAGIDCAPAGLLDAFEAATKHVAEAAVSAVEEATSALAWRIVDEIERARAGEFKVEAFTTGFAPLDDLTFYRPEEVIVTAGRPGQGKTIVAACAARRQAEAGIGVLEFPLEIGREQAVARHIADLSCEDGEPIFYSWILNRDIRNPADSDRVARAVSRLERLPLVIDNAERITLPRLGARVRQVKAEMAAKGIRLGVVILDHLDFIDASDRYAGNRVQEIGEVMKGLKSLARRERVVVHVFSQLNRGVEGREDKRPQLSDLRNAGDIEQVADVVQFVFREAYYLERSSAYLSREDEAVARMEFVRDRLEIITQKSRTSRVGLTTLTVNPGASHISWERRQ